MTTIPKKTDVDDDHLSFEFDDGGQKKFKVKAGADYVRPIAIATGTPYATVYKDLKQRSWSRYRSYLTELGWEWVSLKDAKVKLRAAVLPAGAVIASVPGALVAVVDHGARDVDPRCLDLVVSGYFVKSQEPAGVEQLRDIVTRKQAELRGELDHLRPHPAADVFPMLDDEAFAALRDDIERHGQRVPIAMYGGAVLDGRNRLRACRELGVEPMTVDVPLDVDPWVYVVSLNLRRRHLLPHQAGRVYAKILEQRGVKRGQGRRNDKATSPTVGEVASDLGVPISTFERHLAAAETYEQLEPATKAAVDRGDMTLDQAVGKPKKKPKAAPAPKPAASAEKRSSPKPNVVNDHDEEEDDDEDGNAVEPFETVDAAVLALMLVFDRWPQHALAHLAQLLELRAKIVRDMIQFEKEATHG